MRSARYTLTTEIYDPESGRLRRTRPRYVTLLRTDRGDLTRIERWEGNDFIQQGWNGVEPWALYNGEPLAEGDKDFDEVLYVSGDVNYWIGLPYKLRDPGVNLHDRGVDEEGRRVVGVSFGEGVGLHDGDTWQYWFEEGRTWPVQVAYKEEGRDNWNYLRFEGHPDRRRLHLRGSPRALRRGRPPDESAVHARLRAESGSRARVVREAELTAQSVGATRVPGTDRSPAPADVTRP